MSAYSTILAYWRFCTNLGHVVPPQEVNSPPRLVACCTYLRSLLEAPDRTIDHKSAGLHQFIYTPLLNGGVNLGVVYNTYRKWKSVNPVFCEAFLSFYPRLCRVINPASKWNVYAANLISRRYIGALCLLRAVRTRSFTFYIYYTPKSKKNQISSG